MRITILLFHPTGTDPFLLNQANKLDATGLAGGTARYAERQRQWTGSTDGRHPA